jgi:hypothetical protein
MLLPALLALELNPQADGRVDAASRAKALEPSWKERDREFPELNLPIVDSSQRSLANGRSSEVSVPAGPVANNNSLGSA